MASNGGAGSSHSASTAGVELFTTSTASDIKTKKDCYRLRALLEAKRIPFVEVDLAVEVWRRRQMMFESGGGALPQLHVNGTFIGSLEQVQEMEDFGELDDVINAALGRAEASSAIESSGNMLSNLLATSNGVREASDEDGEDESDFSSDEDSSSQFSESGSSESTLDGIHSSGSLQQLASREEDNQGPESSPDAGERSRRSGGSQQAAAEGPDASTGILEAGGSPKPQRNSSGEGLQRLESDASDAQPSQVRIQPPTLGVALRVEDDGASSPEEVASEDGVPESRSPGGSDGGGGSGLGEAGLEEHFRQLGAALTAGVGGESGMLSAISPPGSEVEGSLGGVDGAGESPRETSEGYAADRCSPHSGREGTSGGEADLRAAGDAPGAAQSFGEGVQGEASEVESTTQARSEDEPGQEACAGSGAEPEALLLEVGPAWLPDHFGEADVDASCTSLLSPALDADVGEASGLEGAGPEAATPKSLPGKESPSLDASGPRGHRPSFSEDDFSPVRRAIDPIWDDTSADESSGNLTHEAHPAEEGTAPAELPTLVLPAVSPSLAEALPRGDGVGVFTLEEGESPTPRAADVASQLQRAGSEPLLPPARRESHSFVRGTERCKGDGGGVQRRASEPGHGNPAQGDGGKPSKDPLGRRTPSRLGECVSGRQGRDGHSDGLEVAGSHTSQAVREGVLTDPAPPGSL